MKSMFTRFLWILLFALPLNKALASTVSEPVTSHKSAIATANYSEGDNIKVSEALKEFSSLSKAERKVRIKEAKQTLKQYKKDKKNKKGEGSTNTLLLVIVTILLPPLGVFLHEGEINSKFWIDLLLTLLFYLPGLIYGLIVVLGKD